MTETHLVAHDIRSAHNIGSLFRTAEGLGVGKVWLSGYSPYPLLQEDGRLPHEARRTHAQITKTALGAEDMLAWEHVTDIVDLIRDLKAAGFTVIGLEQAADSVALPTYHAPAKVALIVGNEVAGLDGNVLAACDHIVEIPMLGQKESFNVAQAAAMTLYHIRFMSENL